MIKEKIVLQAFQSHRFTQNEIINMIPEETLNEIKQKDPHPFFKLFSICHDGVSKPKLLSTGKNEKIHWTKQAVQSMKNVIKKGLKFFHLHNKDNSTIDRRELGEIVAHSQQEIEGKLHQLAIGYFPPETRDEAKNYNVCSHEGLWHFISDFGNKVAEKIEELTGIALGSSKEDIPAFSETGELGAVQCFADTASGELDNKGGGELPKKEVKDMSITLKDVQNYIVENNVHISQLPFTFEDVKADRELGKNFDDLERENKELKTFKENATKEKEDFDKKIKEYERKENLISAKGNFKKILDTKVEKKEIGEKERKFIELRFGKETLEDLTEKGLNEFFNSKLDEYKTDIAPLIDPKSAEIYQPNGSGKTKTTSPDDMTKADNNELLEEDYTPFG